MEDWWKFVEATTEEMEKFFQEVGSAVESFAEEVGETIEVFGEQLQEIIITEVDRHFQDFLDLLSETGIEAEIIIFEDLEEFADEFGEEAELFGFNFKRPTRENNPACIGCQHYHGRVYNGNLLVCAMHPYGWDDENCPDWENNTNSKFPLD